MKNRNLEHKDDWATPKEFYDKLNQEFKFDFDPCPINHDLSIFDGLKIDWGERNFINPPYSNKKETGYLKENFVKKAIFKRIKFLGTNTKGEYVTNKAPMHDSMIVIFDGRKQ